VLLLDEPFGALDAKVRAELRAWLRRLHDEVHVTTVLVTHDQEEALDVADAIAVMDEGGIVQAGAPQELYDRPATPWVMGFLGEVARLDGRLLRPHDLALHPDPVPGAHEAMVERVAHLGFEVRVELTLAGGGEEVTAQLTRDAVRALELRRGDVVWVSGTGAPHPDFAPALSHG
jgi:sulfate transport system ATP-binding protein